MLHRLTGSVLLALAALMPGVAAAQDSAAPGDGQGIGLSLNTAETVEGGRMLTFMLRNGLGGDISRAVYETVLFSREGRVERMTLFDMGALPAGRPRVRRFEVSGLECERLGSLLINGAETCEAGDLGEQACVDALSVSSDTDIGMDG